MKRKMSAVIIPLMISLLLSGCTDNTPQSDIKESSQTTLTQNIADGEVSVDVFKNDTLNFSVVRPSGANENMINIALSITERLTALTGIQARASDDFDYDAEKYEIVIGNTSYKETQEALLHMALNEYGIYITGNKIVVTGHNSTSTQKAVAEFIKLLNNSYKRIDSTKKEIVVNTKSFTVFKNEDWFADIPEFDGGLYSGSFDCADNTIMALYFQTNIENYNTYIKKLQNYGFALYAERESAGNYFTTLTSETGMVHITYTAYTGTVRIYTALLDNTTLAPKEVPAYSKVTENKFAVMSLDYSRRNPTDSNGMGYVFTLEDGSYIIYDGGHSEDATRLYNYLKDNNKRADGKIVIAAWFMTHSHGDHYNCFQSFTSLYASKVKLELFISNGMMQNMCKTESVYDNFLTVSLSALLRYYDGVKFMKAYTGQVIKFAGLEIEILLTHADIYPEYLENLNESSTITRVNAGGTTILFTGDSVSASDETLYNMYKEALKSDILQVNHHGYSGGTEKLFRAIDPHTAMWTTSQATFDLRKIKSWKKAPNYFLINELNVKNIFVADGDVKILTLPFASSGGEIEFYTPKDN